MDKISFNFPEPTDEAIEKTIQKIKDQEGVTLSKADAAEYAKLYEEIRQWFLIDNNLESQDSIAGETADEIQKGIKEGYGLEIKENLAQDIVDRSLKEVIVREKGRIGKELKAIITKYK